MMQLRHKVAAVVVGAAGTLALLGGGVAVAATQPAAAPAAPVPASHAALVSTPAEPSTPEGTETAQPSDGPGGHADPAGANVDHQFNGNE